MNDPRVANEWGAVRQKCVKSTIDAHQPTARAGCTTGSDPWPRCQQAVRAGVTWRRGYGNRFTKRTHLAAGKSRGEIFSGVRPCFQQGNDVNA
jgi:hypothetical protein